MRALIVTGRLVQDQELIYPYYRLLESGFEVDVAARGREAFETYRGLRFEPTLPLTSIRDVRWDLMVIPGGVKCMEHLRLEPQLPDAIAEYHRHGGVIAAICSGAQMLISAGLCKGRVISGYPAIRVDIENAGGTFHEGPAVCFDRLVTAPHYRHLGAWMKATLQALDYERAQQLHHA